jgi:hypothetical protein
MLKLSLKKDFNKWERANLEEPGEPSLSETNPELRTLAEKETSKDLRKRIQQLICDAFEEILNPNRTVEENLNHVIKRQVSLMGRVALEHEWNSKWLIRFTIVLVVLTIAIIFLTYSLLR